jgi:hypothetical protein
MTDRPRKSTFTRRTDPAPELVELTSKYDGRLQRALGQQIRKRHMPSNPRGRPKGAKDKIQRELRAAVLEAGDLAGYDVVVRERIEEEMALIAIEEPALADDPKTRRLVTKVVKEIAQGGLTDYLRYQADKNPTAYLSVLGKVLPKQVDVNVQLTARQVIDEMSERRDALAGARAKIIEAARGADYHAEEG